MVTIEFALFADAANKSDSGKLNLLGVFDRVMPEKVPSLLTGIVFVVRVGYRSAEAGKSFPVEFALVNEDGVRVAVIEGDFSVPAAKVLRGYTDLILNLPPIPLTTYGSYEMRVSFNTEERKTVPLYVEQPEPETGASQT